MCYSARENLNRRVPAATKVHAPKHPVWMECIIQYASVTRRARSFRANATHAVVPVENVSQTDYFLRKRSSLTTSAPSFGLSCGSGLSATGAGAGDITDADAGADGRFVAVASTAPSDGSNCRPN